MKRRYSLKGLKNFKQVLMQGTRLYGKGIRVIVYKEPLQANEARNDTVQTRFAIVIHAKYGTAVERNKIKRRIRAILVTHMPHMRKGFSIIIFPDPSCKTMKFDTLANSMVHILHKSGVLQR